MNADDVDGSKCVRKESWYINVYIFLFPELLTELLCSKCGRNWQGKTKVSRGALSHIGDGGTPYNMKRQTDPYGKAMKN